MIVVKNLVGLDQILTKASTIAFDSETTGLQWQKGDYAFMWAFATHEEEYIFDLRESNPAPFYEVLHKHLNDPTKTFIGANVKFDLHMSKVADYQAPVVDVQIMARLCNSSRMTVALAELAKEIGQQKIDAVKEWIKKNKAYKYSTNSLGELVKTPRYDAVPEEIMYPYAAQDARVTFDLYKHYMARLSEVNKYNENLLVRGNKDVFTSLKREIEITRVLFRMEKRGVLLDVDFTNSAFNSERSLVLSAAETFKQLTGRDFLDSSKLFIEIWGATSDIVQNAPRTEKGNISFTDSYLSSVDSPVARVVTEYRTAYKKVGSYYSSFLDLQDSNKIIHTNFRQASTATGRLSASDPNLQNVSNMDESQFPVRGCFIAPPDFYLVSIDFQAQEMRVMLDQAGEDAVIEKVLLGEDLHQATADMMGCSRKEAKTINFGILYGMGIAKLAASLGVSEDEARALKKLYMSRLPNVAAFTQQVIRKAKNTGKISNIIGRVYNFDEGFSYKAVNYLIQGSSSEITKNAMLLCEEFLFLHSSKSRMILSVHDELVFYVHRDELNLVDGLAQKMREAYKYEKLPMDVGVEIGTRWSSMEGWDEFKARNEI